MSDLFLLSRAQMSKIEPFFPRSHGVARGDDRRVVSGIVCVLKHGLQWKDAPAACGPHKTLCNSFRRWTELRVFDKIFSHLTASDGPPDTLMPDTLMPDTLMIDATHLKAHRTASSLLKGGSSPPHRAHKRRAEHQTPCRLRWRRTTPGHVPDGWPAVGSYRCEALVSKSL